VDDDHPRWETHVSGTFSLGVHLGLALAPSVGGDAETNCDPDLCPAGSVALGTVSGLRGSYLFPNHFAVTVEAGYFSLAQRLARARVLPFGDEPVTNTVRYDLKDDIRMAGPYAAAGFGYRLGLSDRIGLHGHLAAGALFASSRDFVQGTASGDGDVLPVGLFGADQSIDNVHPFVMPSLGASVQFSPWTAGIELAAVYLPLRGPEFPTGELTVLGGTCDSGSLNVACAPQTDAFSKERSPGAFLVVAPRLHLAYGF
ncbi:MAG: hypothetical protein VB934_05855, partial [Polyangiaceae bacterium]